VKRPRWKARLVGFAARLTLAALAVPVVLAAPPVPAARPAVRATRPAHAARPPKPTAPGFEVVRFTAPDSVPLAGRWYPGGPHAGAVVVAPRREGTLDDLAGAVQAFRGHGYSVLCFHARDFGPEGHASQDSLRNVVLASRWVTDMMGALAYARTRLDSTAHLFAWGGHDLPSMIALAAAGRDPQICEGLAIEAPYRNTAEMMRVNGTAVLPEAVARQKSLISPRDEPRAVITRLRVPILVVAGGRDSVISREASKDLSTLTRGPHDYVLLAEGGHTDLERASGYFDRITAWFAALERIPREPPQP
jgi:pimeloyl-ACP methyl ester carboxylesterase